MDYANFCEWLMSEKAMSQRSARDVVSRLKRVESIIANESDDLSLDALNSAPTFNDCTMFIKSQLRRTVTLYNEYNKRA